MAGLNVRFVTLGAGNSTGVPWLQCVMNPAVRCATCADCLDDPSSLNVRSNPSALISFDHPDGRTRHILIDAGKTLRDFVVKQFTKLGVTHIDAVILTHPHLDAYQGLDDLRDLAPRTLLPVYLSEGCFARVAPGFNYLVQPPPTAGLFIAQIDWRIVRPFQPFVVEGLIVTPLPVEHGEPGPMLAFEFGMLDGPSLRPTAAPGASGRGGGGKSKASPAAAATAAAASSSSTAAVPAAAGDGAAATTSSAGGRAGAAASGCRFVYMSDVAAVPVDTRAWLQSPAHPRPVIDTLVVDALSYQTYPTHFSIGQGIACALDLAARHTVFVGMNHRLDYYAENEKLAAFVDRVNAARGAATTAAPSGGSCGSSTSTSSGSGCSSAGDTPAALLSPRSLDFSPRVDPFVAAAPSPPSGVVASGGDSAAVASGCTDGPSSGPRCGSGAAACGSDGRPCCDGRTDSVVSVCGGGGGSGSSCSVSAPISMELGFDGWSTRCVFTHVTTVDEVRRQVAEVCGAMRREVAAMRRAAAAADVSIAAAAAAPSAAAATTAVDGVADDAGCGCGSSSARPLLAVPEASGVPVVAAASGGGTAGPEALVAPPVPDLAPSTLPSPCSPAPALDALDAAAAFVDADPTAASGWSRPAPLVPTVSAVCVAAPTAYAAEYRAVRRHVPSIAYTHDGAVLADWHVSTSVSEARHQKRVVARRGGGGGSGGSAKGSPSASKAGGASAAVASAAAGGADSGGATAPRTA